MIRSAHAVLLVNGMYAMQLRDENIPVYPGGWGLFGGAIEPGESSLDALKRELREELELDIAVAEHLIDVPPCRFFTVDASAQWPRHVLHEGQRAWLFDSWGVLKLDLNEMTRAAILAHWRTHALAATDFHMVEVACR